MDKDKNFEELTDEQLETVVGGATAEIDEFNKVYDSFWAIQKSLDANDQEIMEKLWYIFGTCRSTADYSMSAISALDKGILDGIHDANFKSEMIRTIREMV